MGLKGGSFWRFDIISDLARLFHYSFAIGAAESTNLSSLQNGNPQNPYCAGIDGVMEAYYQSLKSVQLYGPTNFSPVINHVAR